MKVIHVDAELLWRGGQQQAVYLHEGLLARGIDSGFVCRPCSELSRRFAERSIVHKCIPFVGELDLAAGYRLGRYARQQGCQTLVLHSSHALGWGLMAKLFYPSLLLIAVRRVDFHVGKTIFSRFKYKTRAVNLIIAISENIRQILIQDGVPAAKIKRISSGVDLQKHAEVLPEADFRTSWNIPAEAVLVGTVAAFAGHKDYPNLIEAASIAAKQDPRLFFMAVGEGNLLDAMISLARELGLAERFIFTGFQPEVGKFLKSFDIFVLASKKEGLGTSVIDAMALGLPVIGTDAGGIPELITDRDCGLLVPRRDPAKLAAAILELAGNAGLRQKLGEAAQQKSEKFSREAMIESYAELLGGL